MEQIQFSQVKIQTSKKSDWYEEVKMVSEAAGGPLGRFLTYFKGWEAKDVHKLYLSAKSLSLDAKISMAIAINWHMKVMKK